MLFFARFKRTRLAVGVASATLGAALLTLGTAPQAKVDLLETPAIPSVNAKRSLLLDIERIGANKLVATGEFGQILTSTDQGDTWTPGKVPVSVTLTSVMFANEALGYAVGHDGVVLKTEDGGANWVKLIDGNTINQFILETIQAKADDLQARLDELPSNAPADVREQLEVAAEEAMFQVDTAQGDVEVGPSKPLMDVVVTPTGTVIVAGAYGQLLKSTDQGANWTYLGGRIQNPNNYHLNALLITKTGEVWVAGEQGSVFVSSDEGESWTAKKIDYDGSIFGLLEAPSTRTIVAVGLRGHAFRLPFGEQQWQEVSTNLRETFSSGVVLEDGSMLVVGSRGLVAKSNDDFQTLQVVRRQDKLPSAAVVQLNQNQLLLAGMRGFKTMSLSEFK